MTICQYKQSTEQYALFKNKVDLFKDFSQKLILTVLSNLFRTLRTHCMISQFLKKKMLSVTAIFIIEIFVRDVQTIQNFKIIHVFGSSYK
jgi:hypothetical protein